VLSLLVSLGILAVLWRSARQVHLMESLRHIDRRELFLILSLLPIQIAVRGMRLNLLLSKSGCRIGVLRGMIVTLIGTSLNVLLPSNLGDVAKAYYAYRYRLSKEVALSVVIIDKVFAMTSAMLLGIAAAASQGLWGPFGLACGVAAGLVTIIFVPQLIPWRMLGWALNKTLGKTLSHERALEASRLPLSFKLAAVALSLVSCALVYGQYHLICGAMGLAIPSTLAWAVAPVMDLAKAIPLTANGLGTREAVAVLMLGRIGIPSGDAMLSSLFFTAVSLWAPALAGVPFVWLAVHRRGRGGKATDSQRTSAGQGS